MTALFKIYFNKSASLVLLLLCIFTLGFDALGEQKKSKGSTVSREEKGEYVIEKRADGTKVKYKKKTSYDFEGQDIEGLYTRPSGSYISNIKDVKGRTIIRIRKNFDPEVVDSARLVR